MGQHQIEGLWIKPNGECQERAVINVELNESVRAAYLWMEFKEGSVLDLLKLGDYEKNDAFNGKWTFIGNADGKQISSVQFDVQCP